MSVSEPKTWVAPVKEVNLSRYTPQVLCSLEQLQQPTVASVVLTERFLLVSMASGPGPNLLHLITHLVTF